MTTTITAESPASPAPNESAAPSPATTASSSRSAARTKPTKRKPKAPKAKAGTKAKPAKAATKREVGKASARPDTSKRKDQPIKGDLKGKTAANYAAVLAVVPKLPAEAMNANQVAAKLSEKAGKTVWPIPTKRYLETAADRGEVVKVQLDPGKVRYHLPAKGRK